MRELLTREQRLNVIGLRHGAFDQLLDLPMTIKSQLALHFPHDFRTHVFRSGSMRDQGVELGLSALVIEVQILVVSRVFYEALLTETSKNVSDLKKHVAAAQPTADSLPRNDGYIAPINL